MAKKKATAQVDNLGLENVEQTLTKTEQFLEKNARQVGIAVAAVVVVVVAAWLYKTQVVEPKNKEAATEMAQAVKWFEAEQMELVLQGNGQDYGMLDIIEEYGSTPSGDAAHYYAGVAYYSQGNYEKAIEMLDAYPKTDVATAAMAYGVMGDAFVELGQLDDAADFYEKGANVTDNNFTTPLNLWKAGLAYEGLGENGKAVKLYTRIQNDYPESRQAAGIETVIEALK
ncbi:MAG: hypothetical protein RL754_1234 [Bacteroidota bacterium]|jgi:tetratricopeptide (TPR) repeat protein